MIHAVADTNTAISGLLTSGTAAGVLRLAYEHRLTLWGCDESIAEFRRVIRYPRIEKRIAKLYRGVVAFEREYEQLLSIVSIQGIAPGVIVPADRDDEVFVRIALAANARLIVTRDPDLLDLGAYGPVNMISPENFMRSWHAVSQPVVARRERWRLPWRRE